MLMMQYASTNDEYWSVIVISDSSNIEELECRKSAAGKIIKLRKINLWNSI